MRIAHLILVHTNPPQLKRLVDKLMHPDADFYIHVDAKTIIEPFTSLINHRQVFFVMKREKVYWGAYSIVQATVNAMQQIVNSGIEYDYVNLLSGSDYPLKPIQSFFDFLKANPNKAFMEFYSIQNEWQEAIKRLQNYHLTNFPFINSYKLERVINTLLPVRKMPEHLIPVGKSQWFTITLKHVSFIIKYLNKHKQVKRFFKFTWGCDEIIFQTILFNSNFKEDMVNDNLRYIDWSEKKANPKTFTIADKDALIASNKFFARKFSEEIDSEILQHLDLQTNSL